MIYFHIPFCKQACYYCDFHFSTSMQYKEEMLQAMHKELELRSNYLENKAIDSIYFGGGTPSVLTADEIARLIGKVSELFEINPQAEITLEANPDDLNQQQVNALRQTPINRFSIGIQSFYEEDLRWMNRAHNAEEAKSAIMRVQDAGFENITCDLIYGYPLLTDQKWTANMQQLVDFEIPHISSYAMTVEKKTALQHMISKGKTAPMNESQSAEQMLMLIDFLTTKGYEQYEISNFAKPGKHAIHNSNYWKGKHYMGIGPSAHSFNGHSRSWNIANNANYIKALFKNELALETEELSTDNRFNEYVMTSLRTKWGVDYEFIKNNFDSDYLSYLTKEAKIYLSNQELTLKEERYLVLTDAGKLLADQIASDLFIVS
ncbi:radical SAM family heme chaperone HemW [Sphingobacterium sp. DK4209]|uniref:Heme chaperone HemW n=1 Tax=Sphingobacterium zhuxiongii TaxID=2662364 RepID=A0A5Q0QEW7_9SPHI|nr:MULTISPECIES: radical SAM family heme chaperone HemW [unclassified Sphingobacterium]MVZ66512.1 radical SAM family heme chaperone HemW [Sphingobacterium sp. DK4209]QGA27834.1 radical SAM family heme chaperone HemW [Sphingobacterium sp. dk4302]